MTDAVTTNSSSSPDIISKVKGLPMNIIYPVLGVFLFISLFISRFTVNINFLETVQTGASANLWDASSVFRWIWLLAALALVAHYLYSKYIPARFVVSGLIILSAINMFILKPSTGSSIVSGNISVSPTFWAYFSLLVMIGVLVIDYIQSTNKGANFFLEAFEEAKEKVSSIDIPQQQTRQPSVVQTDNISSESNVNTPATTTVPTKEQEMPAAETDQSIETEINHEQKT